MPPKKCPADMIPLWSKNAINCEKIQPDDSKVTLANQKKAVQNTIDQDGCIPKPKGGGGGARMKELSEYYKKAEKTTGKKWNELY